MRKEYTDIIDYAIKHDEVNSKEEFEELSQDEKERLNHYRPKAGRFNMLLKQPKVCSLKVIFFAFTSYLPKSCV